ncbi:hypothetical protein P5V15_012874 [Pogonomyrmex californicus]
MLLMWGRAGQATPDSQHTLDWELFSHQPGIYYEEIGQLRQAESAWRLVIKLSAKELEIRHQQLQDYMEETEIQCRKVIGNAQLGCRNIMRIIERKNTKLITLLTQVETLYKTTDKRRGLLDAVGSVSKILFGTMDADDQKLIDEQLQTLRTNGKVLQHAVANQIKVINATIAHLDELENTLNYNENLIMSATKRLEQRLTESTLQADVDEHLLILTTIMNDLTKDTENIIDYLTYGKNGMIPTRLLPIKHIITALREAATQLTMGLHFPFKIQTEH